MSGEHAGHRQRMRQRFQEEGLQGFAAHEVLELILFYAIPQRNVNPLAHQLLSQFGSLHAVLDAPVEMLMQVEGVGERAATLLHLFSDVSRLLSLDRQQEDGKPLNMGEAKRHCLHLLDGLKEEHFYVICLDSKLRRIRDVLIAKGCLCEVPAYPRVVAQAVLMHNAHAVILCHNHPGGDVIPSMSDLNSTAQLQAMLSAMDVVLSDHMIVAGGQVLSMVQQGLIVHSTVEEGMETKIADSGSERLLHRRMHKTMEKKQE